MTILIYSYTNLNSSILNWLNLKQLPFLYNKYCFLTKKCKGNCEKKIYFIHDSSLKRKSGVIIFNYKYYHSYYKNRAKNSS